MKGYRILLYVAGIFILAMCAYMVYDKFNDSSIFWLDLAVVLLVYTVNIWGIKGLFMSSEQFGKEIASYGIILSTQFIYSLLAIAGVLGGYFLEVGAGWQFIFQASSLLLFGLGSYMGLAAAMRQQKVGTVEQRQSRPLLNLKEKAELLKYKANSSQQLSSAHKQQINTLVSRISMLSPCSAYIATLAENDLSKDLDILTQLVSTDNTASIDQTLKSCELQVTERMKLVTT